MKEHSLPFNPFKGGLRRTNRIGFQATALVNCMNAKPYADGCEAYEEVVLPIGGVQTWPYPQIFKGITETYYCTATAIYVVNSDWTISSKKTGLTANHSWGMADFNKYVVFVNGSQIVVRDPDSGAFSVYSGSDIPTAGVILAHLGQALVADTSLGSNFVQWSHIGAIDFTIDRFNTSGNRAMEWSGEVYAMLSLGQDVIVYGSNGISRMHPVSGPEYAAGAWETRVITSFGIASRRAVVGDHRQHYFVSERGQLYRLTDKVELLDYQEFLTPMLGNHIVLTYDPPKDEVYICDGTLAYIHTPYGLGEHSQQLASGIIGSGGFVGVGTASTDPDVLIVSDVFDMGLRAGKTIYDIHFGLKSSKKAYCALDWKADYTSDFVRTAFKPINNRGVATMITAGAEFRVVLKVPSFEEDFEISDCHIRWKLTDKSAVRGAYGN